MSLASWHAELGWLKQYGTLKGKKRSILTSKEKKYITTVLMGREKPGWSGEIDNHNPVPTQRQIWGEGLLDKQTSHYVLYLILKYILKILYLGQNDPKWHLNHTWMTFYNLMLFNTLGIFMWTA